MSRKYKFINVVLSLIFISFPTWAEDVFNHPLGPQTQEAFSMTCSRLAEKPIVKGNFEQEKILNRLNRSLKSSGNFIIAAGLGMVWETQQPFPSVLALGKDYLVQSRPGGQKTVMSAQGNETFIRMAEVISAVFSGQSQGLLDNFKVYYLGSADPKQPGWELGLLPLDKALASFAVRISMSGDSAIRYILVDEQNGDAVKYVLLNHSFPTELNIHEKDLFSVP